MTELSDPLRTGSKTGQDKLSCFSFKVIVENWGLGDGWEAVGWWCVGNLQGFFLSTSLCSLFTPTIGKLPRTPWWPHRVWNQKWLVKFNMNCPKKYIQLLVLNGDDLIFIAISIRGKAWCNWGAWFSYTSIKVKRQWHQWCIYSYLKQATVKCKGKERIALRKKATRFLINLKVNTSSFLQTTSKHEFSCRSKSLFY